VKRTGGPPGTGLTRPRTDRFRKWAEDGTWARVRREVIALPAAEDDIDWDAQADSTIVRARQHAAGARKGLWWVRPGAGLGNFPPR
jgi:hypothetical protein